jgi:hypothetical protein
MKPFAGLRSPDLQDHQHAGALARGRTHLPRLPGACVQDPRLPLVSPPASSSHPRIESGAHPVSS